MRAAAFVRSSAIIAAWIFVANVQAAELISSLNLTPYTEVVAGYLTELVGHWQAFLQDSQTVTTVKTRTWVIGGLIH